ncbi:MAG: hypothetical protein JXA60_01665 [Candidatus Coatesbacteria bacterium]|nr:hypothetical protein [Candidatus Coatesbacteria bacterium]
MQSKVLYLPFLVLLFFFSPALATLPFDICAVDNPNDAGTTLLVSWKCKDPEFAKIYPEIMIQRKEVGYKKAIIMGCIEGSEQMQPVAIVKCKEGPARFKAIDVGPEGKFIVLQGDNKTIEKIEGNNLTSIIEKLSKNKDLEVTLVNRNLRLSQNTFAFNDYETIHKAPSAEPGGKEDKELISGRNYTYRIIALNASNVETVDYVESLPAQPVAQWFNTGRINILVGVLLFASLIILFIQVAKRGKDLYIRKIAGLSAVDEAIGRATEMGKPILFVPGISGIADIETMASMVILARVSNKVAEYDTPIFVPCCDPIVMTTAQEIVKEGFLRAGRPDAYNPDYVNFITQDQFGYTAGVNGLMMRERPGSIFLLGYFAAESLLLAETGHETGAIQIAGTAQASQLPFFVTACDYTLIGEEFFAASAYLSREPVLMGTLIGQDMGKIVIIGLIVIFAILSLLSHFGVLGFNPSVVFTIE